MNISRPYPAPFAKLAHEIARRCPDPIEQARELSAHLRLYEFLVRTQGVRAANDTVVEIAKHYYDCRRHPELWELRRDAAARRHRQ